MTLPNPQRGEVVLRLDGRDRLLRPTFAFVARCEAACGPLPALLQRLAEPGAWRITDLVRVVEAALSDEPAAPTFEAVGEAVVRTGPLTVLPAAVALLVAALTGGETAGDGPAGEAPAGKEPEAEAPAGKAPDRKSPVASTGPGCGASGSAGSG